MGRERGFKGNSCPLSPKLLSPRKQLARPGEARAGQGQTAKDQLRMSRDKPMTAPVCVCLSLSLSLSLIKTTVQNVILKK